MAVFRLNTKLLSFALFFFALQGVFCAGKADTRLASSSKGRSAASSALIRSDVEINIPPIPVIYDASVEEGGAVFLLAQGQKSAENESPPPPPEPSRAEQVARALVEAYPRRVSEAAFRDGDWAVKLRGQWYYYADGRLLPENLRSKAGDYSPQPFYNYPKKLPDWKKPNSEETTRIKAAAKMRQSGEIAGRSLYFNDALWNIRNRAESWEQQKSMRFLGKSVLVHHAIMEPLALVEQKINAEARRNPKIKTWISELKTISAWYWRNIADVKTRSNHAYGIAIDLLPSAKTLGGLETYWLWAQKNRPDWWNVPYSRRYHPPEPVIKAFEAYGFVWGGKWSFYDTMHFEYRPEILLLNGIELTGEY